MAAMDVMRSWLMIENGSEHINTSKARAEVEVPKWDTTEEDNNEWEWETPDLREGGEWLLA
jgi:hypothetical protein